VHQSKFIHIERRDKLDLAVSMHIAMQTGKWSTLTKRTAEPDPVEYNFNAIQHFYNLAHSQEGYWSALESKLGLDFHRIFYEDLVFDPLTVGNGLMKFLTGVESQIDFSTDPEVVKLEPQAHELNARFKLQFLNDLDFSKDKTIGWFR
jgi:LPS sulfotransferase NodH